MYRPLIVSFFFLLTVNSKSQDKDELSARKAFTWLSENAFNIPQKDSGQWVLQQNPSKEFLSLQNGYLFIDIRVFNHHSAGTLVAATVTESDMVMSNQHFYYYRYKNNQYEPIDLITEFNLSLFFDRAYLAQKNISADEPLPNYLLTLPSAGDTIVLRVQQEIFDEYYMGDDALASLDANELKVKELQLIPNGSMLDIISAQYIIDTTLQIKIDGDWDRECGNENYFKNYATNTWVFSDHVTGFEHQQLTLEVSLPYDSIQVQQKNYFAYGKMISETEGIIFYDSIYGKRKEKSKAWFSSGKYKNVKRKTGHSFILNTDFTDKNTAPEIKIPMREAEQQLRHIRPELFDEKIAGTYTDELRKIRKTQVYPCMYEVRMLLYHKGRMMEKKLYFLIRYGEC